MPDITPDTRAADIIASLKTALESATVTGVAVFQSVAVFDDLPSFVKIANPLKGAIAGIIAGTPQRRPGSSNMDKYVERMEVQIAIAFKLLRKAGASEQSPVVEMNRLASIVRKVLMLDTTRGGKANLIAWGGSVLNGTDVSGDPRLQARASNQAFFVATIPVALGWYEAA